MLSIQNLSKKYANNIWGISDFSLQVFYGEIVCIAGPNGSGKTTIINCILDVIPTTSGVVLQNDLSNDKVEFKKNIAYVSDDILLIEQLTGNEYLNFILRMYEMKSYRKRDALIELFNIKEPLNQCISTYSHGMKKKLQIISAFMIESKIIILDEPARGLDVESVISLKKLIKKYASEGGSVLLSSHDLISAEFLCNRMCIIANGKKIVEGTPEELKINYDANNLEEVFMKSSMLDERSKRIEEIINDF